MKIKWVDARISVGKHYHNTQKNEFNELGSADVLIGGGDIVFRTKYNINDSKVELEQTYGLSFDISFTILDDMTLKRIKNGDMEKKQLI